MRGGLKGCALRYLNLKIDVNASGAEFVNVEMLLQNSLLFLFVEISNTTVALTK